jgi:carbamoyl-phosphate synthase large subunit
VRVLGTQIRGIEITEDRQLFKEAMLDVRIACPRSKPTYTLEEARAAAAVHHPDLVDI